MSINSPRNLAVFAALSAFALAACEHRGAAPGDSSLANNEASSEGSGDGANVQKKTVVERMPDGTTRTTVITTTTRSVEAPPPPPRPADPLPADPLVRYNLEVLNRYRASAGVPALLYDAAISHFAVDGSKQLASDHAPHAHFKRGVEGIRGFGTHSAENQGDPNGVPPLGGDAIANGKKQIATLLKIMIDEGPGGGHHDNMLSTKYRRVGIGLYYESNRLYLTNDFSD